MVGDDKVILRHRLGNRLLNCMNSTLATNVLRAKLPIRQQFGRVVLDATPRRFDRL